MKILFIHGIGEVGGSERELLAYTEQLPRRGYEPKVICPEGGPLRSELNVRGIPTLGAAFPPWRKLAGIWKRFPSVWALRTLLEHLRPDLIHVNEFWWVPQTLRAMPSAMKDRIPVVAHFRQDLPIEKVRQYELGRVDCVCAVSQQVAKTLRAGGVEGERIHIVHSGLGREWFGASDATSREAIRRELGIREQEPAFLTVAHLFERKGYHVALEAFHAVVRNFPHSHYIIVGTGNVLYERRLRTMCTRLGIRGQVHFVGFRTDVRVFLEAADVYLQPSLMEGFGIAVLEAMSRARAVVASRTGGLPDMVVDGETGRLVPPGDVDTLARAMCGLLLDAALRERWGRAGQQRAAERFSMERMMTRLEAVYEAAANYRMAHAVAAT